MTILLDKVTLILNSYNAVSYFTGVYSWEGLMLAGNRSKESNWNDLIRLTMYKYR